MASVAVTFAAVMPLPNSTTSLAPVFCTVRLPSPVLNWHVVFVLPEPVKVSLPVPPISVLVPVPAFNLSLPEPAIKVSAPEPAISVSLPLLAVMTLARLLPFSERLAVPMAVRFWTLFAKVIVPLSAPDISSVLLPLLGASSIWVFRLLTMNVSLPEPPTR